MLRSKHVTSWNYLTVQLSRLSADDAGDPDLYGMFYGGFSVRSCTWPRSPLRNFSWHRSPQQQSV